MTKFDEEGFKKKYIKGVTPILQHIKVGTLSPTGGDSYISTPFIASVFGCCGAGAMTGMSGIYLKSEAIRQEFVSQLRALQNNRTIFYLPTTNQIRDFGRRKDSVLKLLQDLSGKEVHKNPNRVHGPNSMHLHVLDPGTKEYKEAINRFLVTVMIKDYYGYRVTVWVPRYMAEEFGYPPYSEEPKEIVAAVVAKKTGPRRDAFGRFVKRI